MKIIHLILLIFFSHDLNRFEFKYTDHVTFADPTPIIRFSEVVLAAAEANVRKETPDMAAALELLNKVRNRALPADAPKFTLTDFATPDDMLTAILNETRIEFLAEGRRFPNIHRLAGGGIMTGVPLKATSRSITSLDFYTTNKAIPTDYALPYSSNLFIWPIPLEEILTNSTAPLEQNPGY
jgi:hypothetical protein